MNTLQKLDLMGVASLASVTAALLVGWIATTASLPPAKVPAVSESAVTLSRDGGMKLTVTASRETAVATRESRSKAVASRAASTPTLDVALPLAFRP